ncbi:pilus assembly protein TadG-related protein [Intrasporangium calvum]|uniref:pilus assembly protein TadG-related protein n=1 Tax=Intrasporangium calvum TaxID=53358 RepID=UPI002455ECDF|nr:pilus assembly protein TadG-related protein [Intrasporangium calvum]
MEVELPKNVHPERGGVAVIAAVVVAFVMLGALAISVDVGFFKLERGQLQNAADATALALAQECASGDDCGPAEVDEVANLLGDNSWTDGETRYDTNPGRPDGACGRGVGLPGCATVLSLDNLAQCPPLPNWLTFGAGANIPYVETYTNTRTRDGGDGLLPWFGEADAEVTQSTCARAAWGPPAGTGPTLPLTMNLCDWNTTTENGTKFAPPPQYSTSPGTSPLEEVPSEVLAHVVGLFTHDSKGTKCSGSPGQEYPGGFAWLDPEGDCVADIDDNSIVPGDTGAPPPGNCKDLLQTYLGSEVLVPIFDSVSGTGANGEFHISGVASFYLAGFGNVPSAQPSKSTAVYVEPSTICANPCNSSSTYVWGWFTSGLAKAGSGGVGSGPSRGVTVVVPAG